MHPYYLCHHKGCEKRGKSTLRDKLEDAFETLLRSLVPSEDLTELCSALFQNEWQKRAKSFEADKIALRRQSTRIDAEIKGYLDRIVKSKNEHTITSYEKRIDELASQQISIEERLTQVSVASSPQIWVFPRNWQRPMLTLRVNTETKILAFSALCCRSCETLLMAAPSPKRTWPFYTFDGKRSFAAACSKVCYAQKTAFTKSILSGSPRGSAPA